MTSWSAFALRRARASWALVLTLLALVTVTTAIIAGTVGYSQAAAITAARGALTQGEPTQTGLLVQTRLADDPARQDEQARSTIAAAFDPAPVAIGRVVVTEPRPVSRSGAALDGRVVLMGGPDLALAGGSEDIQELVEVVDGAWPDAGATAPADGRADAPTLGALHVGAAAAWDVQVGEVLVVENRAVEVAATWQPVDPQAAYWFGDALARTGQVETDHGPLVVDEEIARAIGTPFVRWPVRPDGTQLAPDDLRPLASAAETLRATLAEADGVAVRGVAVDGDLAPTAAAAATNLATARALGVVPLSVLVLVTGLAVVQLARLLSTTREPQAQLLVARGATRGQVLLSGFAESAVVALVGTVLGAVLAWVVMLLIPGGELVGGTILTVAGLTLVGVLLVLAAVAALQAARLTGGQAVADRSGRAQAATALATVVLVLAAAALAWWQLRRAGSPLVTRADGTLGTDLVAGAAPALLLAAAAVVAAALLGPISRALELLTRPSRAAGSHLASAQVSRRLPVYAVPVVLTVLAVGATTLAALYAGTSAQLRDDLADVEQGAPVQATLVRPPATTQDGLAPPPPPDLATLPELAQAVLVWQETSSRVGDVAVPVTMADTERLASLVPSLAGDQSLVPTGLERLRDAEGGDVEVAGGIALPAGATEVQVALRVERALDPWGLALLQGLEEDNRAMQEAMEQQGAGALPPGAMPPEEMDPGEQARLMLQDEQEILGHPTQTRVRLTLRDDATGVSSQVWTAPLEVPGPGLQIDDEDLSDITTTPASAEGTLTITLPEGRATTIEALEIEQPRLETGYYAQSVLYLDQTTGVSLTVDGTDLLGDVTGWGSPTARTPEAAREQVAEREQAAQDPEIRAVIETMADGSITTYIESNMIDAPVVLDTTGSTWTVTGGARSLAMPSPDGTTGGTVLITPGATYTEPSGGSMGQPVTEPGPEETVSARVPVALTPAAASAAALSVGDTFSLTFAGSPVPAVLTDLVPAVPGRTDPLGALADSRAMSGVLARTQTALAWPDQVWARPAGAVEDAVAALRDREDVQGVTGPSTTAVTDATSAGRLVFWVASAGAVLLALTGIAAVAATLLSSRRPEVAVLRALGMPPTAQARSRALELGGVVLAAVLLGLVAGWLVSLAVVPELASSTTRPGQVQLPAVLRLEAVPWVVLVTAGGLVLLALTVTLARRVRAQALDRDYREEVR